MINFVKLTLMSLIVAVGLQACNSEQGGLPNPKAMLQAVIKKNKQSVTIKRDAFGMAHIFADDNYGLFFGYGFAMAQDRLYQLEIGKRSIQGKIAEVLGADYIDFDKKQRNLFWPERIHTQLEMLAPDERAIFTGFAAGINRHIEEVTAKPAQNLPFEFTQNQFMPENWNEYDVAMLFVGSMLLRYGDFNTELENQVFLDSLRAQHGQEIAQLIFDAVNPRNHDKAPTSIPANDWQWQKQTSMPRLAPNQAANHVANHASDKKLAPPTRTPQLTPLQAKTKAPIDRPIDRHIVAPPTPSTQGFSNALVLGPKRLQGAKTVLINGPQFGWYVPSYTYSIGFHTDDWHAVGNTPIGYLFPAFGHNEYITWGLTWGASDNVDIFRETRNPQNAEQYRHQGQWKRFDKRVETIKVKNGEDVEFTAYRTVHGPVVEMNEKYAYAKQRGWAGRELDTLMGWAEMTKAKNHAEWRAALARSAVNVNWYYADRAGNIATIATGAYPKRAPGHDNRLP
ncbi:MAG: penicillin acylase family protein, partial [Alphaproteobacteria bacterium]|nr:penicillin acylase family protein [Alphaproteobacteria bacterium]